jgi:hypothetical protein
MVNNIPIKVYNKEDKLKLSVSYSKVTKTVSIYKYNGETIDTHQFVIGGTGKWHAYYEMTSKVGGELKKHIRVSDNNIECMEFPGDTEEVRTTVNLNSMNEYENRTKYFDGEKYSVEFKNGELHDFRFRIKENKINEYLKTLQDGKEKS